MKSCGSKDEVWHGHAYKTKGGLTKANLIKNKKGKVVSLKKHLHGAGLVSRLKQWHRKSSKGSLSEKARKLEESTHPDYWKNKFANKNLQ